MNYSYWKIEFTSCEGNYRWAIARFPADYTDYDVENKIPLGGVGDDVASIISVTETNDEDYGWDFCD